MNRKNSKRKAISGTAAELPLDASLFTPGERVCVAVSGGADSIALLRALVACSEDLGLVLRVLHVNHGLRGAAADADAGFVANLAEELGLPCEIVVLDTKKRSADHKESIEEAARNLRYKAFRDVLESGVADKIAIAHTLDDQAETVLMKLLRGAWTEGLSGIHPTMLLNASADRAGGGFDCVRPLLGVRRMEIESYLRALGQPWREDETNRSLAHTRNRVRHALLPQLREFNPRIEEMLAHIASNARAEEQHWQAEMARVLPRVLLLGKPVRGGGRSVETLPGAATVALDLARLNEIDPALRRRVLRAAAKECGAALDFASTERLFAMAAFRQAALGPQRPVDRLDLIGDVRVIRSARELRFERRTRNPRSGEQSRPTSQAFSSGRLPSYELPVPGTIDAPAFDARYTAEVIGRSADTGNTGLAAVAHPSARVRAWQPGDRVELLHSRGPKKVKEVLERMGVRSGERSNWPVAVWRGKIVWMRGVELAERTAELGQPAGEFPIVEVREHRLSDK